MLTLILPPEIQADILLALRSCGRREVGGILMGEHLARDTFAVRGITIHKRGGLAAFVRRIEDALAPLRSFFSRSNHEYSRFNYIGEWHSHPSFSPFPSARDDESMREIVQDDRVGANFAVLLIVKLEGVAQRLDASVHTYLPDGSKHLSRLSLDATLASREANAGVGDA